MKLATKDAAMKHAIAKQTVVELAAAEQAAEQPVAAGSTAVTHAVVNRAAMSAVFLAALMATASISAQAPAAPPLPVHTDAECEVWARELSFADALAAHDQAAFAEHLHPQAAFGVSRAEPMRTRETIAEAWRGLVEGEGTRLLWYPQRTTISPANPDIAWSTGPALFENLAPGAEPRYTRSQYTSLWMRDTDGTWRVLFDDGTHPRPATEAEAQAFRAGRQDTCL